MKIPVKKNYVFSVGNISFKKYLEVILLNGDISRSSVFCANSLFLYHSSYSSQTLIHLPNYILILKMQRHRANIFNPYLTQSYMRFILNELTLELAFVLECTVVEGRVFFWGGWWEGGFCLSLLFLV